uniref:Uncharacterized protein n=1 Tax=Anguilla anguilla TaxID=7936 RepID=A0A0E9QLR2_ANGAN
MISHSGNGPDFHPN